MTRAKYVYLTAAVLSIAGAGLFLVPADSVSCRGQACRETGSPSWDFSNAPERRVLMFPSPGGLTIPPG
jgi:hypothetical protein